MLETIKKLCAKFPNDADLGRELRKLLDKKKKQNKK